MSVGVLFLSRKNLKAPMTSHSDLAASSAHFHSCRISGSKSLSNIGSVEETKSEVRTQKNILESLQLVSLGLLTTKLMAFKLLQYGASKNALLKRKDTRPEQPRGVLPLNWFQGELPRECVWWAVPQLQDPLAAHKSVPVTMGLELPATSYFQISNSNPRPLSSASTCMHCIPALSVVMSLS